MNIQQRINSLRQTDLFNNFSVEELHQFAAMVNEVNLEPGQILFREGDPGHEMYVVVTGTLRIFKDKRIITPVLPGDYVGEMAILEDEPRSASVEALTDALLLEITSSQFRKYLANQPKSLVSMMKTLSSRIRRDTEIIAADFEKANILIHDMKNSLSTFLYLDLLKSLHHDERTNNFITHMQEARDNLASMMTEALSGAKKLYHSKSSEDTASLAELIKAVVATECTLHPDLHDKKITVVADSDKKFAFDKLEIRRALTNLLINAGQASKPGDTIEINLSQSDHTAEVSIHDNGPGIPPELCQQIFVTHFTTKENGNGFGLASCMQIIETNHRGKLTFENKPQGGCVFRFTLPMNKFRSNA